MRDERCYPPLRLLWGPQQALSPQLLPHFLSRRSWVRERRIGPAFSCLHTLPRGLAAAPSFLPEALRKSAWRGMGIKDGNGTWAQANRGRRKGRRGSAPPPALSWRNACGLRGQCEWTEPAASFPGAAFWFRLNACPEALRGIAAVGRGPTAQCSSVQPLGCHAQGPGGWELTLGAAGRGCVSPGPPDTACFSHVLAGPPEG